MNNCDKNNYITYAPVYFNLLLQLIYFIFQHFNHKKHIKKLDNIKNKITSSQNLSEEIHSKDLENIKKIIIDIISENENNT